MKTLIWRLEDRKTWRLSILNKEKKYGELKESIRLMNSQRSDAEKISLVKKGKTIGNEVIKRNEIIHNSLI